MASSGLSIGDKEYIAAKVVEYLIAQASGMSDSDGGSSAGDKGEKKSKGKSSDEAGLKKALEDFKKDPAGINALVKKITMILAPAALVASIIGSESSGFKVLMSSVKVLGNMLGSILTPAIIFTSAMILTLSDMIGEWLLPNLEKWYTWIITNGMDWLITLENGVIDLVNGIFAFVADIIKSKNQLTMSFAEFVSTIGILIATIGGHEEEGNRMFNQGQKMWGKANMEDRQFKGNDAIERKDVQSFWKAVLGENIKFDDNNRPILFEGGSFSERMPANLRKVNQEFRQGFAPSSQSMGIADAARNAQMAGLQMTPFEIENLKILNRVADSMDKAVAALDRPVTKE